MQHIISRTTQKLEVSHRITELPEKHTKRSFTRTFSALKHRNFRLFWTGQMLSLIGTWMQTTGQAWLVLQITKSAWALGIVGALQFLPVLLFSLFGGVLADRVPKRTVVLFTQSSAMLLATVLWLLVVTGTVQLWHIFVLAVLLGITNSLDMPTRQAFVSEMVGHEDLPNAIALNSSVFNMARIIGPGLGGLIIAWLGIAPLFLLNALSFIPVLIGLALINTKQLHTVIRPAIQQATVVKTGTIKSIREGLAYIKQKPSVLLIIVVVGTISLFGINFNIILPLFATTVLHAGPAGFGFISSAFGVGSLLSALWLAWNNKKPNISFLLLASIVFCVLEMLFAISHWYLLSLVLIACVGFAQIAFSAISNTTLQTVTPDHLRGRIMSVYMLVFTGSIPLGNLLIGGLVSLFNAPIALLICGGLSLIAAVAGWIFRKPAEKDIAQSLDRKE
jgi:MFS family permease